VHITGEFDNRPGTRRVLGTFSCVDTYRTGACRRLYMITPADVRPGTVLCPSGVVRDEPDTVRCPADFTRIVTYNDEFFYLKFAIIPSKKQVVKIKKLESDSDSNGDENHTCSILQFTSTCSLHGNHRQLLKQNISIFAIMFLGFRSEMSMQMQYVLQYCKNTSLLTGGSSTHKTSAGRGRASADLLRDLFKVSGDCQTSYDARTVGARLICANAGRAPPFYHQ